MQDIEFAEDQRISQRGGLLGVRSTSVSGNNPGSEAFPGGAKTGREQMQQTMHLFDNMKSTVGAIAQHAPWGATVP